MLGFDDGSQCRRDLKPRHSRAWSAEISWRYQRELGHRAGAVGLLVSGGLDSSILLKHLLDVGRRVKPLYIHSGLCWQAAEKAGLERYLDAVRVKSLEALTVLDLPLADVYGDHWSITGRNFPEAGTPDEAMYLPGRNAIVTIKAALWCQRHGIDELAIGTLRSNPFQDASDSFFDHLEHVFTAMGPPIRLLRPFAEFDKRQVMELGRSLPLSSTFSCIAPHNGAHCGRCNKCAERREAFRLIDRQDPTRYASVAVDDRLAAGKTAL